MPHNSFDSVRHVCVICIDVYKRQVYNIVICDDEETLIDELKENLIKYAAETNKEFCFFIYHDGSELLQEYRSDYDLIFMDIKMEKLNGLKTAEEIRKMDSTVGLIFLTSLKKYVWRGYEYGAVNYLLKPVKYKMCIRDRLMPYISDFIRISI